MNRAEERQERERMEKERMEKERTEKSRMDKLLRDNEKVINIVGAVKAEGQLGASKNLMDALLSTQDQDYIDKICQQFRDLFGKVHQSFYPLFIAKHLEYFDHPDTNELATKVFQIMIGHLSNTKSPGIALNILYDKIVSKLEDVQNLDYEIRHSIAKLLEKIYDVNVKVQDEGLKRKVRLYKDTKPRWCDLKQSLGKGAFGEVSKGIDLETWQEIALKIIKLGVQPGYDKYAFREAQILSRIKHKNILGYAGDTLTPDGSTLIIATEYCNGGDLNDYVVKQGKLSEEETIRIAKSIGQGLRELKRLNVVHRDLKLQNILLKDGVPKIADFGVSKVLKKADDMMTTSVGTKLYWGHARVNAHFAKQGYSDNVDLYSIGTMIYKMMTGKEALMANTLEDHRDNLEKLREQKVEWPADVQVTQKLKDFVDQLMHPDCMEWETFFSHELIREEQEEKGDGKQAEEWKRKIKELEQMKDELYTKINGEMQNSIKLKVDFETKEKTLQDKIAEETSKCEELQKQLDEERRKNTEFHLLLEAEREERKDCILKTITRLQVEKMCKVKLLLLII